MAHYDRASQLISYKYNDTEFMTESTGKSSYTADVNEAMLGTVGNTDDGRESSINGRLS